MSFKNLEEMCDYYELDDVKLCILLSVVKNGIHRDSEAIAFRTCLPRTLIEESIQELEVGTAMTAPLLTMNENMVYILTAAGIIARNEALRLGALRVFSRIVTENALKLPRETNRW